MSTLFYGRTSTPHSGNLQQALCLPLAPHQAINHSCRELMLTISYLSFARAIGIGIGIGIANAHIYNILSRDDTIAIDI